jgi:molecular chaperone HtpG
LRALWSTSLFLYPVKGAFDLWDRDHPHGVKLYVRRVFIADDTKHLLPSYLRFVKGVVDSADLPLNVSREFLQQNREIDKIRSGSVKKILGELKRIAEDDQEKYAKFWAEFGKVLKEGVIEDHDNRDSLAGLLRFSTTRSGSEQSVSLADYVGRMAENQKAIYFLTAESHEAAAASPHLEVFNKQNIEVLLLGDPVDEWLITHLTEYEEKSLKSIAKGAFDLDDLQEKEDKGEKKARKAQEKAFKSLLEKVKEILKEQVKDVALSRRLTDSPACLIADENDLGGNLQRILQATGRPLRRASRSLNSILTTPWSPPWRVILPNSRIGHLSSMTSGPGGRGDPDPTGTLCSENQPPVIRQYGRGRQEW